MLGSDALCWGRVVRLQSFPRNGTQTRWKEDVIFFSSKIRVPFSVISAKCSHVLYVNSCRKIKCYFFCFFPYVRWLDLLIRLAAKPIVYFEHVLFSVNRLLPSCVAGWWFSDFYLFRFLIVFIYWSKYPIRSFIFHLTKVDRKMANTKLNNEKRGTVL